MRKEIKSLSGDGREKTIKGKKLRLKKRERRQN